MRDSKGAGKLYQTSDMEKRRGRVGKRSGRETEGNGRNGSEKEV